MKRQIDLESIGGAKTLFQLLRDNGDVQSAIMEAETFEEVMVTVDGLNLKYSDEQLEYFKKKVEAKLG